MSRSNIEILGPTGKKRHAFISERILMELEDPRNEGTVISVSELADRIGSSPRTTRRCLTSLRAKGSIASSSRHGADNSQLANRWRLTKLGKRELSRLKQRLVFEAP